ncbi:MAG: hypothetical protein ABF780_05710 [Bifidobacterium aquikefiri]|uniref:Uncharacterized protein n=1 Tax=Bifidobacterium aquikefiri TaxID=1653207 RepID=A0A261G2A1_9BIFI|nr:hypothetical protein [Bifidobacterium aquikefiri]OZG65542.1 hypothetical protein BAQU_1725 [Bifidobacterium aquikefiri]
MMDPLACFYVHTAIVRTQNGVNGMGVTTYSNSNPFPCLFADGSKLVRDSQGQRIIGATTLTCNNQYASLFQPGSQVLQVNDDMSHTLKGSVVLVNIADSEGLELPDHTTVSLV